MSIPGLLGGPPGARSARADAPRRALVRGAPHHLAYITAAEAALLRARGGGLTRDGRPLRGPAGVPAFDDGGDGGGGEAAVGNVIRELLPEGPDPHAAQLAAWRSSLNAPIDQTQRNFVTGGDNGGAAAATPVRSYDYGAFPTAASAIGALRPLSAPPGPATPPAGSGLPPAPNLGLPSYAPPGYGLRPETLARLQQIGVMPRYGASGLAGSPAFNTLLGRMR